MLKIPQKIAFIFGSVYEGKETQSNARCCHCARTFAWDDYTGDIYRGKLLCPECLCHFYGYCNSCGKLYKYADMDEDIICKGCRKKEPMP